MKIVVCRDVPFEPARWPSGAAVVAVEPSDFAEAMATAEYAVPLLSVPLGRREMAAAPRLRMIANYAVGYDNVDILAATELGICVTNTPEVLTDATADFTMALILAAARHLVPAERWLRQGQWQGWQPSQWLGLGLSGATLGILGVGRIGQAVALRARAFGMEVVGWSPRARPAPELGISMLSLDEVLRRADVVTLHCALTGETRHLLSRERLASLRRGALVINTARGACIDAEALAEGLHRGHIGAAALDVFEAEPQVPAALLSAPRTILTPHLGSATTAARRAMAVLCQRNIQALVDGIQPPALVNVEVWSRRREVAL